MAPVRINKFLSDSGICSRRKADEHILAGNIAVNGKTTKELGLKIDPEKDEVSFNGQVVKKSKNYTYYVLNKPKGIISTASDEKDRKTVMDLVPKEPRVYPVGRLDRDSEGLIILTNDGELTNLLTHPSGMHEKEYELVVKSKNNFDVALIERSFVRGMKIGDRYMKADKTEVFPTQDARYKIRVILHTGYNRQLRKMCDKMGLVVLKLTRFRVGKLELSKQKISLGEYKKINREDII